MQLPHPQDGFSRLWLVNGKADSFGRPFLTENEKSDPKGRLAKSRKLVPEARVELARRETTVFETAASAIPPLGHISLHSITEARIRVHDKIAPRASFALPACSRRLPARLPVLALPATPGARFASSCLPRSPALPAPPCLPVLAPSRLPVPRALAPPRASRLPTPASRAPRVPPRARPAPILLSRIARLRAVRGLRTGVKLVR